MSEFTPNGYFVDKDGKKIEVVDAAARAAAAGAMAKAEENAGEISALSEEIEALKNGSSGSEELVAPTLTWTVGSINGTTGAELSGKTRIKTDYVDVSQFPTLTIVCENGYKCAIDCYDEEKNILNSSQIPGNNLRPTSFVSGERTVNFPSNMRYARFLIANETDETIDVSAAVNVTFVWFNSEGSESGDVENGYYTEKVQAFSALFDETTGLADSLLFFSDPHLADSVDLKSSFDTVMDTIQAVYEQTPTSFVVCGGDWLKSGNTKANACWLLGRIDGAMKARFDRYINVVGNHDTNYQGYDWVESGKTTEGSELSRLSTETIRNLWYRKQGNAYFAYEGDCTRYYVFDTGTDWESAMNEYRWEQVDWFANELLTDDHERCAAIMHITAALTTLVATPFLTAVTQVAAAYNAKTTVTLNEKTYDFSQAAGHFYFVLSGHQHTDATLTENGIPVAITTNLSASTSQPPFDLVLVDYGANKLRLVRIGGGDDRTIEMA